MTKPLIDRDGLTEAINRGYDSMDYSSADAVLDYLRSALTPEALNPHGGSNYRMLGTAEGLYRRIFGASERNA